MVKKSEINVYLERKINTCDENDYNIEAGTTHIIHFLYSKRQTASIYDVFNYKFIPKIDADSFDMKQTQLIKSEYFAKEHFDPIKSKKFEVRVNNIRLPSADTTYWCHVYKLDKVFNLKHHITAFESVITKSSKGIVHHMELFHCMADPTNHMEHYTGPCNSEAKPKGLVQCRKVIAAWAMGAARFEYPQHVGGVIGGKNYSPYLVLEIHFDNAAKRSNIIDSSGIRVFYQGGNTEKLRQYDAGIMEIGLEYNPKNSIPPQSPGFHLHGYCLSECTQAGLPKNGITVFASQLHTHLTGRRVWTSLIRNNRVEKIINSDNHYDQMFQEIRLLREPVRVLPGDALVNTCVYNTKSRQNMTFGGYSIRDEMCVNYMHYYPIAELEVCKSSISDNVLDEFFSKMKSYDYASTSPEKTIEKNFNSIRWTPLTSRVLSKLYDISPIAFSCNSSKGMHIDRVYRNEKRTNNEEIQYFDSIQPINLAKDRAPIPYELSGKCFAQTPQDYYNY